MDRAPSPTAAVSERRSSLPLWRRLICLLRSCPFKAASDDTGCWGECTICGRRAGFVSRAVLRAWIEREVEIEKARRGGGDA